MNKEEIIESLLSSPYLIQKLGDYKDRSITGSNMTDYDGLLTDAKEWLQYSINKRGGENFQITELKVNVIENILKFTIRSSECKIHFDLFDFGQEYVLKVVNTD